jgi:hypothetical protein
LIAQDAMRSCEKSDLIGKVWLISHSKVFDKNADLSQGSYLSYFISKLQMLKYLENNELRSIYSNTVDDKTIKISVKLLNYPQGDTFKIKNGILSLYHNKKQIDTVKCDYFLEDNKKSNIPKGSIGLWRYSSNKPLVVNIYQVMSIQN